MLSGKSASFKTENVVDNDPKYEYTIFVFYENVIPEVIILLVEMRARSQITLPNDIVKNLGLSEGDRFEVIEHDGGIFLCPVVIYPKAKLEKIVKIIKDRDQSPSVVYESVGDMFKDIGIDLEGDDV